MTHLTGCQCFECRFLASAGERAAQRDALAQAAELDHSRRVLRVSALLGEIHEMAG